MSIWKSTMTWLGLGPDADYETGDPGAFSDPALRPDDQVGVAAAAPPARGPVGPMSEHDHSDFSAE